MLFSCLVKCDWQVCLSVFIYLGFSGVLCFVLLFLILIGWLGLVSWFGVCLDV